jgi:hypothetical protein
MGRKKKYDVYVQRVRQDTERKAQVVEKEEVVHVAEVAPVAKAPVPVKTDLSEVPKRFFVMSVGADRAVAKVGKCLAGVWIEVPVSVYNSLKTSESWKVKAE